MDIEWTVNFNKFHKWTYYLAAALALLWFNGTSLKASLQRLILIAIETFFELANLFICIFICIHKTENSKKVNMEYPGTRRTKEIRLHVSFYKS